MHYNEKGKLAYSDEFQNGKVSLKRKNLFIPIFSNEVSMSLVNGVNNVHYPLKFLFFPHREEIDLILE